ncbi:MAG: phosphotransferase [Lachnospiraceae bacterium]|nr:phosphotransferase [Lachnospiraceae bacterium]
MNDYCLSLLEQYDIEVLRTRKGRGAYIIDTPQGPLIFKEYVGPESRAAVQNRLLKQIQEAGVVTVEQLLPTREETFLVKDVDETGYILKTYPEGRELNISDREECLEAVRLLGRLHQSMILTEIPTSVQGDDDEAVIPQDRYLSSQQKRYEKGCKELRRVRKYLLQRSQKTDFELSLLHHYGYFQEQADRVCKEWTDYSRLQEPDPGVFCHGDYQYHNILFSNQGMVVVNFEKFVADHQIRDLYLLLRKLLEKSSWSLSLGQELIAAYEQICPMSALSRIDLYYRLAYPEKFRKIVNFYYNSGKAWIPGRNQEKLDKIVEQEKNKQYFLEKVFQVI